LVSALGATDAYGGIYHQPSPNRNPQQTGR
jgi:hypothetical protein